MQTFTIALFGKKFTVKQDTDGKFSLPDELKQWENRGTSLKPAWEPIIVAMKPLDGTFAHNAEKYGVAGLNIDATRIGKVAGDRTEYGVNGIQRKNNNNVYGKQSGTIQFDGTQGRWPANLVLDEEAGAMLDEQTGTKKSGKMKQHIEGGQFNVYGKQYPRDVETIGDSGGASRFFYCAKCSKKERNFGLDKSVIISIIKEWKENNITKEAKLAEISVDMDILQKKGISESGTKVKSGSEWNTILFGKNIMEKYQPDLESTIKTGTNSTTKSQILNWLVTLFTKEYTAIVKLFKENGGNPVENVKDCNLLKITTNEKMVSRLGANNVVLGMQLKISVGEKTNVHPTVKPLTLMKYLCTLLKMPSADQVILDPFMGSGTTGMACAALGIGFIGIDKELEYCEISVKRIAAISGKTLPVISHTKMPRAGERFVGDKLENVIPVQATTTSPNENPPRNDEHRQSIINAAATALRRTKWAK